MEAALVTGMFNFGFSKANTLSRDVGQNKDSSFEKIFSKNMEKEKGIQNEKENIKDVKENNKNDVDDKDDLNKITDDKENIRETKEKGNTKDKDEVKNEKDNENEMTEKINGLVEKILTEVENIEVDKLDVENISLEDVKKLVDVENIELSNEELLKLQDVLKEKMMQKVVEVGPQSVETEKITFNKYDDLESRLEALQERLGKFESKVKEKEVKIEDIEPELNAEELSSNLVSQFEEKSALENKDGKNKDEKSNITDIGEKRNFDNKVEQLDVEVGEIDSKILDVKAEDVSDTIMNKTIDMQEQIDVIKQVSEKVKVNLFEDKSEMIIKLKPDHLGKVTVEIAVENGNITAKFLAESEKVKEILESNMQDLKDHLANQGMAVQNLSVSVGNENRGPLFEQNDYSSLRKRRKIQEVSDEAYIDGDDYGINELAERYYWPDSTVSFSA